MKRIIIIGTILGTLAATIAYLLHVPPIWALAIGLGVAAIVWFRIHKLIEGAIDGILSGLD